MLSKEEKKELLIKLEKPYYSIYECAEILGVHERTVRNNIKSGNLKAGKIGRQWRISKNDLLDFIQPKNV